MFSYKIQCHAWNTNLLNYKSLKHACFSTLQRVIQTSEFLISWQTGFLSIDVQSGVIKSWSKRNFFSWRFGKYIKENSWKKLLFISINLSGRLVVSRSIYLEAYKLGHKELNKAIILRDHPYLHTHLFNLHPEKWFEGYPVKSTQFFLGCHLRFF